MKKEFHIWDYPQRGVTVALSDKALRTIVEKSRLLFPSFYKLGLMCNINYQIIHQAVSKNSFPLYLLNAIISPLNISRKYIESSIVSYKSYGGKKVVEKPTLPIKESQELYELVGHVIGDGHISIESEKLLIAQLKTVYKD